MLNTKLKQAGYMLILFCLWSCDNTTSKKNEQIDSLHDEAPSITTQQKELLNFFKSGKYVYSTRKSAIPKSVMDTSEIGDSIQRKNVNLTDIRLYIKGGDKPYDKLLHFVLVNPESCLLLYTQGGRGSHQIVLYKHQTGINRQVKLYTSSTIKDTVELRQFLNNPESYKANLIVE